MFLLNFIKKNIVPLVLLVVTGYFIFPYLGQDFRISFGEGPYALNPNYINFFYIWQDKINLGNYSSNQSLIALFTIIWKFFGLFSFIAQPSLIYVMFCGYFLAGLFFYYVIRSLFPIENQFVYVPPVLLYILNMYRVASGNSDENILLFISLPLYFLFYYKLLNEKRWCYVFLIVILSILTSTLGKNIAFVLLIYLLMLIYFIFFLMVGGYRKQLDKIIQMNLVLGVLLFLSSLFWLLPLYIPYTVNYAMAGNGKTLWSAVGSGSFFDHFRFMGFWAFKDVSYFPYSPVYYQPLLIFTTYSVSIFSMFYLLFIKKKNSVRLKLFIATLTIISYFLVAGSKGIFGFFYQYLYEHISLFKIFREPYSKFTPLFIFAVSFGLLFSIYYSFHFLKNKFLQLSFIIFLSAMIIFNAWPIFVYTYEKKPSRPRTVNTVVQIPKYWQELNQYLNRLKLNQWIFVFQNNGYGTNSIWEYGLNVVGNAAEFLTNSSIKTIVNVTLKPKEVQSVFDNIFKKNYEISNLKAYLGLLNSRYILQENDTDWRYSGFVLPPSQSNQIIKSKGFIKVAEFGQFTPEYLQKIPNLDPDPKTRNELYTELTNQPGLILYQMEDKYFVPLFYTPKKIFINSKEIKNLDAIVSQSDYLIPSAIFLTSQNPSLSKSSTTSFTERPVIEFKRINPTKYRLVIHQARKTFPLIFSTNFSPQWKIFLIKSNKDTVKQSNLINLDNYKIFQGNENDQASREEVKKFTDNNWLSKIDVNPKFISKNYHNTIENHNLSNGKFYETWLMKPSDNKTQLMANGFANAWIINPADFCSQSNCQKNPDGSYDFQIIIEFSLQKYLWLCFVITLFILIISFIFITISRRL